MTLGEQIDLGVAAGTALLAIATIGLAVFTWRAVVEAGKARDEAIKARKTWASMAVDASRARLDASAPDVSLRADGVFDSLYVKTEGTHNYDNVWPITESWTLPRNDRDEIAVKFQVNLKNHSTKPVSVTCSGPFWSDFGHQSHTFDLDGGHEEAIHLLAIFKVGEWVENYLASRREGAPSLPHRVTGEIWVDDGSENGVSDRWYVSLSGFPIERSQSNAGQARFSGKVDAHYEGEKLHSISTRRRTYWLSRSNGTALPDTEYETPGPETEKPKSPEKPKSHGFVVRVAVNILRPLGETLQSLFLR